jgi:glycosyltransferase involved in cell wall biosynthesis
MKLAVIAAMYNESEVIEEFYTRVVVALKTLAAVESRLVFIDDGSSDSTLIKMQSLKETSSISISIVSHSTNLGLEKAIMSGLRETTDEVVVVLDADLQDPPELIPFFYNLIFREHFDLVVGKRESRSTDSFFKKSTAWFFYRITKLISLNKNFDLDSGNFRGLHPLLVKLILNQSSKEKPFRFISSILSGRKTVITYERQVRFAGKSKFYFKNLIDYAFGALFAINHNFLILGLIQFSLGVFLPIWFFFLQKSFLTSDFFFLLVLILSLLNIVSSSFILSYFIKYRRRLGLNKQKNYQGK